MSHNRQTPQDMEAWPDHPAWERRLTQRTEVWRESETSDTHVMVAAGAPMPLSDEALRLRDAGRTRDAWRLKVRTAGVGHLVGPRLQTDAGGRRPVRDVG